VICRANFKLSSPSPHPPFFPPFALFLSFFSSLPTAWHGVEKLDVQNSTQQQRNFNQQIPPSFSSSPFTRHSFFPLFFQETIQKEVSIIKGLEHYYVRFSIFFPPSLFYRGSMFVVFFFPPLVFRSFCISKRW